MREMDPRSTVLRSATPVSGELIGVPSSSTSTWSPPAPRSWRTAGAPGPPSRTTVAPGMRSSAAGRSVTPGGRLAVSSAVAPAPPARASARTSSPLIRTGAGSSTMPARVTRPFTASASIEASRKPGAETVRAWRPGARPRRTARPRASVVAWSPAPRTATVAPGTATAAPDPLRAPPGPASGIPAARTDT